jgi:hypothetical protein
MHYTVEKLMYSQEAVQAYFVAAKNKWSELLSDIDTVDLEDLATRLSSAQFWFEKNCGGRFPGQEVMAWSGFGYLYRTSDGFGEREEQAVKLQQAFKNSMCSLEVKSHAKKAAGSYYVGVS